MWLRFYEGMKNLNIKIIIPSYNEEDIIKKTYLKLKKICNIPNVNFYFLFVDDGSSDSTLHILKELSQEDNRVEYLTFSRNFGKESAMFAGLKHSLDADAAIIIDSDLQHPPELIPQMLVHFKEGFDQVIAKRDRKGEKFLRKLPTKIYYWLINKFVDIPIVDGIGDYRLLSNRAIKSIVSLEESQRFSKGIFSWIGYSQKIIEYQNQERSDGKSKWTFLKLLDYGVDGVVSFNNKPLRLMLYFGLFTFAISILYILLNYILILVNGISEPGYFTLIFSILFLGSIQLISLGVIGEYIGRIYYEVKSRPHYILNDEKLNSEIKNDKING